MNKKFKVLANLAIPVREDGKKVIGLNSDFHEQWMNNFAQLIIQECINICDKHPSKMASNNWNGVDVAPDIIERFKENFGVE